MLLLLVASAIFGLQESDSYSDLVLQLGSDRIEDREDAARKLKAAGRSALPALEKASRSADAELAGRAAEMLSLLHAVEGEEIFKKLECRLLEAQSIRFDFRTKLEFRISGRLESAEASGTVTLKGEGNIRLEGRVRERGEDLILNIFISGGQQWVRSPQGTWPATELSPLPRKKLAQALSRIGVYLGVNLHSTPFADQELDSWEVSQFEYDPKDPGTLSYQVAVAGRQALRMTLVFDPKTLVLIRRRCHQSFREEGAPGRELTLTEDFPEFKYDEDFPKSFFQPSSGK